MLTARHAIGSICEIAAIVIAVFAYGFTLYFGGKYLLESAPKFFEPCADLVAVGSTFAGGALFYVLVFVGLSLASGIFGWLGEKLSRKE